MSAQTPNVYVMTRDSHNLSDARNFGDIIFLTDEILPKFYTNQLFRLFKPIIENSKPYDYILVSGLSVATSIACSMFAVTHEGRLNLLLFDSKNFVYRERRLDLSDLFNSDIKQVLQEIKPEP